MSDNILKKALAVTYEDFLHDVYVKLAKGRKGHDGLLEEAIAAVMGATGGAGWIVEDRGMDAAEHLRTLKRDGRNAVVRVKDLRRDVFGDGRHDLARRPCGSRKCTENGDFAHLSNSRKKSPKLFSRAVKINFDQCLCGSGANLG